MRRNQELEPMRWGRETDLSPTVPGSLMNPTMFFNVSPWQMMRRIQEDMDLLLGPFLGSSSGPGSTPALAGPQTGLQVWSPSVDISENEREWTIETELPGVKREDIDVRVQDHQLILRAELRQEEEAPAGQVREGQTREGPARGDQPQGAQGQGQQAPQRRYYHRERRYGFFERVFPLPESVDEEQIRCEFRDGILTLHLPKTEQAREQSRRIPIGTGVQAERRQGDGQTQTRGLAMAGTRGGEASSSEPGKQERSEKEGPNKGR